MITKKREPWAIGETTALVFVPDDTDDEWFTNQLSRLNSRKWYDMPRGCAMITGWEVSREFDMETQTFRRRAIATIGFGTVSFNKAWKVGFGWRLVTPPFNDYTDFSMLKMSGDGWDTWRHKR